MKKQHLIYKLLSRITLTFFAFITIVSCTTKPLPVTPETALQSYLQNEDESFEWNVKDSYKLDKTTVYDLRITSQQWREHIWKHTLTVIVPDENDHDGALLYITGGKNESENKDIIWEERRLGWY